MALFFMGWSLFIQDLEGYSNTFPSYMGTKSDFRQKYSIKRALKDDAETLLLLIRN